MVKKLRRIREFVLHDVWHDIPTPTRIKAFVVQSVRVAILAVREFLVDRCLLRATALAYVTLLTLAPLLAFAFAVLKGVGVQDYLRPLLTEHIAPGQEEMVDRIIAYVAQTDLRALGAIGLVFLLWTTVKVLSTIESSFNHIWHIDRSRPPMRKVADYVSVLVISPILLVAAMSLTAAFQSNELVARMQDTLVLGFALDVFLFWARFVATWIAFAAIYIFMPNTKVRLVAALVGGIIAGTAWQVAFWAYAFFQVGVAHYGAIYTTFAAVPIFMIWLYLGWTILLFGAEISWAVENVGDYGEQRRVGQPSFASLETVAVRAMAVLAAAFQRDGSSQTAEQIAKNVGVSRRLAADVLAILAHAGLCTEVVSDDDGAYHPGRALDTITPADVLAALRAHGQSVELPADRPEAAVLDELLKDIGHPAEQGPRAPTFREIAARLVDKP